MDNTPHVREDWSIVDDGLHVGANPDTCRHFLVRLVITLQLDLFLVCLSCDSTIDSEFKDEFHWDYDIDHNLWKRCAKPCRCNPEQYRYNAFRYGSVDGSGMERPQARTDSGH